MNEAIKRLIMQHYANNPNDPRMQRFIKRMQMNPEAQKPITQRLLANASAGLLQ